MSLLKGKWEDENNWKRAGANGDGTTVTFSLPLSPQVSSVDVFVNGLYKEPTTDYTISGKIITLSVAPVDGQRVSFKYKTKE